jgi:UDP-N-acetylmuramyl pentapeptide phosphotransferase/UDP-N-acetylglucosamine-1-phosphate transferase
MPSLVFSDVVQHLAMMLSFSMLLGFGVTAVSTWLLCNLSKVLSIGQDKSTGVQKFHVNPTSRLGGVAIFLGLAISGLAVSGITTSDKDVFSGEHQVLSPEFHRYWFWFLLAAMPVWLAGLAEDLTHRVGPAIRLVMATISAACLLVSLGIIVKRTDVWPIDLMLNMPGVSLLVTLLVVAGFTHSVNIVDGFHGLACGLVIIALSSLAFIAFKAGDALLFQMCMTSWAVVLGFFLFNWPKGAIFLGDAGAYLIGFWVVELGILLAMRNPQISPMAPVVVGLLPLIETLFSMYRRNVLRNLPVNQPDALHLHTLVYRRLLINTLICKSPHLMNKANSRVAMFFWLPAVFFSCISCLFIHSTVAQLLLMLTYVAMYLWLYNRLVNFKSPYLMRLKNFT